jgi:hypothetical protein
MNARDELAADIDHVLYTDSFYGDMFRNGQSRKALIDAILAAGYVKHRTITTTAEVDALPAKSVVMTSAGDAATVYSLRGRKRYHFLVEHGPATVLYEPEVTQ